MNVETNIINILEEENIGNVLGIPGEQIMQL